MSILHPVPNKTISVVTFSIIRPYFDLKSPIDYHHYIPQTFHSLTFLTFAIYVDGSLYPFNYLYLSILVWKIL